MCIGHPRETLCYANDPTSPTGCQTWLGWEAMAGSQPWTPIHSLCTLCLGGLVFDMLYGNLLKVDTHGFTFLLE